MTDERQPEPPAAVLTRELVAGVSSWWSYTPLIEFVVFVGRGYRHLAQMPAEHGEAVADVGPRPDCPTAGG